MLCRVFASHGSEDVRFEPHDEFALCMSSCNSRSYDMLIALTELFTFPNRHADTHLICTVHSIQPET